MKKKVITLILALTVVGMYTFSGIGSAFASDVEETNQAGSTSTETTEAAAPEASGNSQSNTAALDAKNATTTAATTEKNNDSAETDTTAAKSVQTTVKSTSTPKKAGSETSAKVSTQSELKTALADTKIKTIEVIEDIGVDSVLRISHDVTIKSTNGSKLVRKAGFTDNMIYVQLGKSLSMTDITVDGNKANVTADKAIITVFGSLNLDSVNLVNNNNSTKASGGAITSYGSMVISDSTISGNKSGWDGGGIWNYTTSGTLIIKNSSILENEAADSGGGLFSSGIGVINISGSEISGNKAASSGGGIDSYSMLTITDTKVTGNTIIKGAGGGIDNHSQGTMTLEKVTITGNKASGTVTGGGGVANFGKMTMKGGSISDNSTNNAGGGLYNQGDTINSPGICTIIDGVIDDNKASGIGGGVYNGGTLNLDGEINGNTSALYGGGIYNYNDSKNYLGVIKMTSGTIENNSAEVGGGIYNYGVCSVLGGTIADNKPASSEKNGSAIYLVRDVTLASAATIKGDCFVYFDQYANILLKDSFSGHASIEISVPTEKAAYPSYKGFQVIKAASGYKLTDADRSIFTCIGNGSWGLRLLSESDVDNNKDLKLNGKADTIVLWDKMTTYNVVANYYTSTDNGATYTKDNRDAVSLKGATEVKVGSDVSVTPENAWANYNNNTYSLDKDKSTTELKSADIDASKNVLTLNYYRIASSTNDNPNNNNTDNGGGTATNTSSNNHSGSTANTVSNNDSSHPSTGDNSSIALWSLLGASGIILAGVAFGLRRRENNK